MEIGSSEWKAKIVEGARKLGLDVQPGQADQFASHALTLQEWNQKINLTTIDSPMDMVVKHFLDSLVASPFIKPGDRLLDVGSGGGFPGIPLKVMQPSLKVTLVDTVRKKVNFLKHVIRQLRLSDIHAVHSRIEELRQERGDGFDVIVCRAFSNLDSFAEMSLPLLAPDGRLIAYKAKGFEAEARQSLSGDHAGGIFTVSGGTAGEQLQMQFVHFNLPFLNLSRTLMLLNRFH